jgi:hypothetical protein
MGIFDVFKKMGNNCVKNHTQMPDDFDDVLVSKRKRVPWFSSCLVYT